MILFLLAIYAVWYLFWFSVRVFVYTFVVIVGLFIVASWYSILVLAFMFGFVKGVMKRWHVAVT